MCWCRSLQEDLQQAHVAAGTPGQHWHRPSLLAVCADSSRPHTPALHLPPARCHLPCHLTPPLPPPATPCHPLPGHETKVFKNATKAPSKRSTIERSVDKIIFVMFGLLAAMCIIGCAYFSWWTVYKMPKNWYLMPEARTMQYDPSYPVGVAGANFITSFILYGGSPSPLPYCSYHALPATLQAHCALWVNICPLPAVPTCTPTSRTPTHTPLTPTLYTLTHPCRLPDPHLPVRVHRDGQDLPVHGVHQQGPQPVPPGDGHARTGAHLQPQRRAGHGQHHPV